MRSRKIKWLRNLTATSRVPAGFSRLSQAEPKAAHRVCPVHQGKGPQAETGAGVFKVAPSTQVPTPQSKLAGTRTASLGFCNHRKKNKKKDYCLLLQDWVGKFCGRSSKLNLLQCLLYGWRCRDRPAPESLAQEAFPCFLCSLWAWLRSAHRSITTYSITGFFQPDFVPQFSFRSLQRSLFFLSLPGGNEAGSHTFIQVGMSKSSNGDARKGPGEAGKLLLGMGATGSAHRTTALVQLLQPLSQKAK